MRFPHFYLRINTITTIGEDGLKYEKTKTKTTTLLPVHVNGLETHYKKIKTPKESKLNPTDTQILEELIKENLEFLEPEKIKEYKRKKRLNISLDEQEQKIIESNYNLNEQQISKLTITLDEQGTTELRIKKLLKEFKEIKEEIALKALGSKDLADYDY
ncbi:hypothetical protein K9L67_05655 [Candidatus Woesearchaeota archaeon]|nr:hypothetical protein [Candidatus Woesearchaeota archaeon]MCF8014048.1 hypothetical protein [Candidatus Woesearchaeota archaeon]